MLVSKNRTFIAVALICGISVFLSLCATETEKRQPYTYTKTEARIILDRQVTVPYGEYRYYSVYIDVSGKEGNIIRGTVTETTGKSIFLYVYDQEGFNAWRKGDVAQAYFFNGGRSFNFSFVPDHSDYYYFVLINNLPLDPTKAHTKTVHIWAKWEYQTKTR